MPIEEVGIALAHALIGWSLCGATMGLGMVKTTLRHALVIHAVAAPIIFAIVSAVYFAYFSYSSPFITAIGFAAVVIAMDFFVVALLIQRELAMFRSVLGTWLPFGLIFLSTLIVGFAVQ